MIQHFQNMLHLLAQIGFRKKESLVYAILLTTGPNVITNIARKIDLPRSTTYNIIIDLVHRGILRQNCKNRQQTYEAIPHKLLEYLQHRRIKINHQIEKMHETLNHLSEHQKK